MFANSKYFFSLLFPLFFLGARVVQIQTNKQKISKEKLENVNFDDDCADLLSYAKNSTSRWTNDETLLVVKCLRKYGKDFQVRKMKISCVKQTCQTNKFPGDR